MSVLLLLLLAVYSLLQAAFLGSTPGALRSRDALVQKMALKQLQRVLSLRQAFGETLVLKLAEADILDALVAVLQPGTDACKLESLLYFIWRLSVPHSPPLFQAGVHRFRPHWASGLVSHRHCSVTLPAV
jgi:hypothetical protein